MSGHASAVGRHVDWSRLIDAVLHEDGVLTSVFQPIVDVAHARVVGYEALSRFTHPDAPAAGPDAWFAAADELGVGPELQARALTTALRHRATLPKNCFLSLNVDPEYLIEPSIRDALASQSDLRGLVVEFTEHRSWSWDRIEASVQVVRSAGALIAIDDAGSGYSGLQQILRLRPSILKLDRSLVDCIDRDEAQASLVEMFGVFANRVDAWILAEGIETAAAARRIAALDVPLAQGWFFGRPAPAWAPIEPGAVATLRSAAEPGETLHRLVESTDPVRDDETVGGWLDGPDAWRAVTDVDGRPLGLVDAASLMEGSIVTALVVNVHSSPHEVAQRLSTFGGDAHVPVVVTGDDGRYVGLLHLRRLLHRIGRRE